jgi:N-acetylmuramic acid 6-phosphate etherase
MATERIDPRYVGLDTWPIADALAAMLDGQLAAVSAVQSALPVLAAAVTSAADRLGATGRLIYVGAGTSGRLGVQDGSELAPTFNWPLSRTAFVLAGGLAALTRSAEGAEDDVSDGRHQIAALRVGPSDVVIGTAASGTTPFTIAAIVAARRAGALTLAIASNPATPLLKAAEHPILIATGAEVIAGSTRMKAGTAHKVALNLISSGIMVRLGRVFDGVMVDMQTTNAKLERRAVAIVAHIAACTVPKAQRALIKADGDLKRAILIALGLAPVKAEARLKRSRGVLRRALALKD